MRVFKNEERVFIKIIGESEKNDRGDEDDGGNPEDGHREERGNWEKERKRNREE